MSEQQTGFLSGQILEYRPGGYGQTKWVVEFQKLSSDGARAKVIYRQGAPRFYQGRKGWVGIGTLQASP